MTETTAPVAVRAMNEEKAILVVDGKDVPGDARVTWPADDVAEFVRGAHQSAYKAGYEAGYEAMKAAIPATLEKALKASGLEVVPIGTQPSAGTMSEDALLGLAAGLVDVEVSRTVLDRDAAGRITGHHEVKRTIRPATRTVVDVEDGQVVGEHEEAIR